MKQIAPFIVMIALLITLAVIITSFLNYQLRRRVLGSGTLDENKLKFISTLSGWESEALKWGLIFLFGGIGLVFLEFIPYSAEHSSLPYGVEAIFIAIGFLVYYFIRQRQKK